MRLYEHRDEEPLSQGRFLLRMVGHAGFGALLVAGSLLLGMVGYHTLAEKTWLDSFLNAAMLLGGMGPVGDLPTRAGKLFAGFFALYAGTLFLVLTATMLTPVFHRVLHRFHWDADRRRATGGRRKLE
jgi:hypothetical protein